MSKSVFGERLCLGEDLRGRPPDAGSPGYEEARKVHNGLIDKHPALIARCRGVADVVDAVRFARERGLELAVRGGGHNVAGHSTTEGGLLLDLSLMTGVQVDAGARIGRAQGGVTWGLFNRETQVHGLATTGGVVSTTGVAGLTLGGGLGWLMGRYGLALDNLLSVNLVLADGRALTASEQDNADLFWAVRGGGGNFGVATSFDFRLHPVGPLITGGLIAYPFSAAWDVLRLYRYLTASLPDDMALVAGLLHAPDGSKLVALVVCHCGAPDAAERAVQPIKHFGSPVLDEIKTMVYCDLNTMLDAGYPRGALNYWKSSFLPELTDDAIRVAIDCFARCRSPMSKLLLEHLHGAVTRVDPADTAFPHRAKGFNLLFLSEWHDPAQTDACIAVRASPMPPRSRSSARIATSITWMVTNEMMPWRGRRRLWGQLPAAAADQGQGRSNQFISHESKYPASRLTGSSPSRCCEVFQRRGCQAVAEARGIQTGTQANGQPIQTQRAWHRAGLHRRRRPVLAGPHADRQRRDPELHAVGDHHRPDRFGHDGIGAADRIDGSWWRPLRLLLLPAVRVLPGQRVAVTTSGVIQTYSGPKSAAHSPSTWSCVHLHGTASQSIAPLVAAAA